MNLNKKNMGIDSAINEGSLREPASVVDWISEAIREAKVLRVSTQGVDVNLLEEAVESDPALIEQLSQAEDDLKRELVSFRESKKRLDNAEKAYQEHSAEAPQSRSFAEGLVENLKAQLGNSQDKLFGAVRDEYLENFEGLELLSEEAQKSIASEIADKDKQGEELRDSVISELSDVFANKELDKVRYKLLSVTDSIQENLVLIRSKAPDLRSLERLIDRDRGFLFLEVQLQRLSTINFADLEPATFSITTKFEIEQFNSFKSMLARMSDYIENPLNNSDDMAFHDAVHEFKAFLRNNGTKNDENSTVFEALEDINLDFFNDIRSAYSQLFQDFESVLWLKNNVIFRKVVESSDFGLRSVDDFFAKVTENEFNNMALRERLGFVEKFKTLFRGDLSEENLEDMIEVLPNTKKSNSPESQERDIVLDIYVENIIDIVNQIHRGKNTAAVVHSTITELEEQFLEEMERAEKLFEDYFTTLREIQSKQTDS